LPPFFVPRIWAVSEGVKHAVWDLPRDNYEDMGKYRSVTVCVWTN
jgi:hypothetical protein